MEQIKITKARITDAEALTGLVNRAYRPAPRAEGWTHESTLVSGSRINHKVMVSAIQNSTVLVARCGQVPTGCVQIEMKGHVAHIGMLAVAPSIQTHGIGKLLLEHAEKYAVKIRGAEASALIVIAARKELIEFYLRRGYSKTDEHLQYPVEGGVGVPTEDAMLLIILKKDLNSPLRREGVFAASAVQVDA